MRLAWNETAVPRPFTIRSGATAVSRSGIARRPRQRPPLAIMRRRRRPRNRGPHMKPAEPRRGLGASSRTAGIAGPVALLSLLPVSGTGGPGTGMLEMPAPGSISAAMQDRTAKFRIGQVVRHRVYPFRGVIFDVDPVFSSTAAPRSGGSRSRSTFGPARTSPSTTSSPRTRRRRTSPTSPSRTSWSTTPASRCSTRRSAICSGTCTADSTRSWSS